MKNIVSIIIPNYNGVHFLEECLDAILRQDYPACNVILVDNASLDGSVDFVQEHYAAQISSGRLRIMANEKNYGFSRANNLAIGGVLRDNDVKYVVTLNNDAVVEPSSVGSLVRCAERHPKAGSVMSKMVLASNPDLIDSAGLLYSRNGLPFTRGKFEPANRYNAEEEIFGACAGACLYRTEALKESSPSGEFFDEDFFAYCEDVDLAFGLRWAGWECWYCPGAVVRHHGGGTKGISSDFIIYHRARNNTWLACKNLPVPFIVKNAPWLCLGGMLEVIFNILFRGTFAALWGKCDAYAKLWAMLDKSRRIARKASFSSMEKFFVFRWRVPRAERNI